jgi:hypothetical protein
MFKKIKQYKKLLIFLNTTNLIKLQKPYRYKQTTLTKVIKSWYTMQYYYIIHYIILPLTLENHYKTFSITSEIGISDTLIFINLESKEQMSYRFPNVPSTKNWIHFLMAVFLEVGFRNHIGNNKIIKNDFD